MEMRYFAIQNNSRLDSPQTYNNKIAILVAGGTGSRMGNAGLPKQFMLLRGKPILWHSLHTFLSAYADMALTVVIIPDFWEEAEAVIAMFDPAAQARIRLTAGGATRFDSVKKGLSTIKELPAVIGVHDAVRCLVSVPLIRKCYEQALQMGSAIPAVAATDSIRIENEYGNQAIDRNKVRIIQTPQTFRSEILLPAFAQPYRETFTDEASVVEAMGQKIHLIEGEHANIKITRPIDLIVAEQLLAR